MVTGRDTLFMGAEDQTVVDPTPRAQGEAVRGLPRKATSTGYRRWRVRLGHSLVVLAFVGMACWVYVERRSVRELRETARASTAAPPAFAPTLDRGVRSDLPIDDDAPEGSALERRAAAPRAAAELIILNRLEEALPLYRELAGSPTGEAVYQDVVRVLERRLACRSTHGGSGVACGF